MKLFYRSKATSTLTDRRYNEGCIDGAANAKREVLGFLRRTGASAETLKAWLEKGEHEF